MFERGGGRRNGDEERSFEGMFLLVAAAYSARISGGAFARVLNYRATKQDFEVDAR